MHWRGACGNLSSPERQRLQSPVRRLFMRGRLAVSMTGNADRLMVEFTSELQSWG
jgi:hypothetical protein